MMEISEAPLHDERWLSFCAQRNDVGLFQSPEWSRSIEATYGFSMRVLLATESTKVVAGLPFAHIDDFRGARRVALAFADDLEPVPEGAWPHFEGWIAADTLPWTIRTVCVPSLATSSKVAAQRHQIELPATFEEASQRFHYKHVQNLKQAEKAGLTHRRVSTIEGVEEFFRLHSLVRKNKHGLLPQPFALFKAIFDEFFPERGFVLLALQGEVVVSAMFFVASGKTLYYKFSASALESLLLRPNHFLISKAIETAISDGYERLDLGISDAEGLIRFKERVGGAARDVFAATYNPREKTSAVIEIEQTLGKLTQLLTEGDLPIAAAQRGGELLYRFFT